jgi:hypothetical protein
MADYIVVYVSYGKTYEKVVSASSKEEAERKVKNSTFSPKQIKQVSKLN